MKETVNIGYIGLGRRGLNILKECLIHMKDVRILWLCDTEQERLERAASLVPGAKLTTDYRQLLRDPEVDAVFLMTGWRGRPRMAVECMEAGKYTAMEVGCADRLEECWALVDAWERTKVPVMMLENDCYFRRNLMALNMARQGILGEIVHCTGAYAHYLNKVELFKGIDGPGREHYRLEHYIHGNRENYPTHELGPVSKILGLNRGNKMNSLVCVSSKSRGLRQYAADYLGADSKYANTDYQQGDIVNTLITCENGETILLTLDTTLPRPYYCQDFSVRGTKGMIGEERNVVYLEGMEEEVWGNLEDFYEKYDHPLYREGQQYRGSHGGIDFLVCRAFLESVKRGINTPIDVYDTAAWMSIGPLTEEAIAAGKRVQIPDFTRGKWKQREAPVDSPYNLD